ncbi:hypothetical protein Stsp01_12680 [Streptomyces sp. NBRC 13847]|nr:hypothetical protein Stsp01_12680 [Streptomyces sp. NBRC 13847]
MAGVITASEPSWIAPFTGLSPRRFGKLVTALRREGVYAGRRGRPRGQPLEDRALLVLVYWRTNLTMRQLAQHFDLSKSTADRTINQLGPLLALVPRRRFAKDAVLIVDGTLVPTRDQAIAEQSKNYRYSTNHQVVIERRHPARRDGRADATGQPQRLPGLAGIGSQGGRRKDHDDRRRRLSGHRPCHAAPPPQGEELPDWKQEHNRSHKQVRARVEHTFARMKTWKILRDCRLKGDGVHHAMLGIARLHNLALSG